MHYKTGHKMLSKSPLAGRFLQQAEDIHRDKYIEGRLIFAFLFLFQFSCTSTLMRVLKNDGLNNSW